MKKYTILILLILIGFYFFGQTNIGESNKDNVVSLEEMKFLERLASTIDLKQLQEFDSLNNYNPLKDSTDYRGISVILILQHNYELAIYKINQELYLNPKNEHALNLKGLALNESNRSEESLEFFNAAINLNDTNDVFFVNRGLAFYRLKEFDKAISDFSRAIELNPYNHSVYVNRAFAYEGKRQFKKAIKDYSSDIKLFGGSADSYNNRGRCYMILNKNENAFNDYNKALEIEPNKLCTIFNKGILYIRQKDFDKGCELIKKAKDLGYNDGGFYEKYCK